MYRARLSLPRLTATRRGARRLASTLDDARWHSPALPIGSRLNEDEPGSAALQNEDKERDDV